MRFLRHTMCTIFLIALSACGGGGGSSGGGGGGGGGGSGSSDGLAVATTSLTFNSEYNAAPPASQDIAVTVTNSQAVLAGAAYRGTNTPAPWLDVQISGTVPNVTFHFSVNTTALSPGAHTAVVSVGIAKADQTILAYRDVTVTYTVGAALTLSDTTGAVFQQALGSPATAPSFPLQISGNVAWTAAPSASWITLSATSGIPGTVQIGVNSAGLAVGTYQGSITFSGTGKQVTYPVTLTVIAVALSSTPQLSFSGINGAPFTTPMTVDVHANNSATTAWTATTANSWVVLDATQGTLPGTVHVSVNPALGNLASGSHTSSITFTSVVNGSTLTTSVPVTLDLTPATLSVDAASLDVGGSDGTDSTAPNVHLSLNTGANAYSWSTSGSVHGAQSSPGTGTVSATPATVTFTPSSGIQGGKFIGTITFSAAVNGDVITRSLPVTVRNKPHRLFVHEAGVALLSTPTLSKVAESVVVRENRGQAASWSATSNQAWLKLPTSSTSSGTTGGSVALQADPTLAAPGMNYADVTITSSDPTIVNSGGEVIRVGLYKTAVSPAAQATAALTDNGKRTGLAADPVRPYVYVSNGNASIDAYNIYTGALAFSISGTVGSDFRGIAVSDDGTRLYALDLQNLNIAVADLTLVSPALIGPLAYPSPGVCTGCNNPTYFPDIDFARVNGRAVLTAGGLEVLDASTGAQLVQDYYGSFASVQNVAISGDGTRLFAGDVGVSNFGLARYAFSYDELSDTVSMGSPAVNNGTLTATQSLVTDYSGQRVYLSCFYQDILQAFDGTTLQPARPLGNIGSGGPGIVGPDGLLYCGRVFDAGDTTSDVWVTDPATGLRVAGREFSISGELDDAKQLVISGDGLRVITRSNHRSVLTSTDIP